MLLYDLRILRREADGSVRPPLAEHAVDADDPREAVCRARLIDVDMDALGANAILLVDATGNILWSLRREVSKV